MRLLLDKSFNRKGEQSGFKLYTPDIRLWTDRLRYIHLTDAELILVNSPYRENHPYVSGIVESSLPDRIRPGPDIVSFFETLPELKYCTENFNGFYLGGSSTKIETIKEAYGFEGKIRVVM